MPANKTKITESDLQNLQDKIVIVTGSNTGVGYGTVQFLARKGAKVYLAARNEQKALEAIEQLKQEDIGDGHVEWLKLDLSSPRLAKDAAEEFLKKEKRLDILINNAAIATGPFKLNNDGLLDIATVNHIGHYVFTKTLIPLMKRTSQEDGADVRIVNITSMAHAEVDVTSFDKAQLNKDYGNSFRGMLRTYANTKLANILHAKELQKRFDAENVNIICLSVHPGTVMTRGSKAFMGNIPLIGGLLQWIMHWFFVPVNEGAFTSVFAAASPEVREHKDRYKGAYLVPVAKITTPSKSAQDEKLAVQLHETTESILQELGI